MLNNRVVESKVAESHLNASESNFLLLYYDLVLFDLVNELINYDIKLIKDYFYNTNFFEKLSNRAIK